MVRWRTNWLQPQSLSAARKLATQKYLQELLIFAKVGNEHKTIYENDPEEENVAVSLASILCKTSRTNLETPNGGPPTTYERGNTLSIWLRIDYPACRPRNFLSNRRGRHDQTRAISSFPSIQSAPGRSPRITRHLTRVPTKVLPRSHAADKWRIPSLWVSLW